MEDFTTTFGQSAAEAIPAQRARFIRKTYLLLAAAIAAFILVEGFLFASGAAEMIATLVFSGGAIGWLLVLGLFMVVSYIARSWATSETSTATQFLGLGIAVLAEAVIFVPLITIAAVRSADPFALLMKAGIVTIGLFLGITATVFITRSDFSFPRPHTRYRRVCCPGFYRRKCPFRVLAWDRVCLRNGRVCGDGDTL
jgi:FtsH-binding integral membrane protein